MVRKLSSLLKNRTVLWVVTAMSALVLMGYLTQGAGDAAIFMVLTGLLVSFFTANMVVVLSAAIGISMLWASVQGTDYTYLEAFAGKRKAKANKEPLAKVGTGSPGPLNGAESVQATIANIEEILGSGSVGSMTDSTKRLLDQQSKLGKKLEDLLPLVDKGMGVLNQVGGPKGVQKMLETLEQFTNNMPGARAASK